MRLLPPPRTAAALVAAGFRRWATYRQAALAGAFTNTVFGVVKVSILLGVAAAAGGSVAGYDRLELSTYTWLSQGLIAIVHVFGWTEVAERVRTGDIAIDLARPLDLQVGWLLQDLGRAAYATGVRFVVPLAVGALFFGLRVPESVWTLPLFALSTVLAVIVSFGCRLLVNLCAFWLLDVRGLITFYVLTSTLLMGMLVPVPLFPDWLRLLAYSTPFPAIVQAPVDVASERLPGLATLGLVATQLGWAVLVLAVGRIVLARATRRLVVQGG